MDNEYPDVTIYTRRWCGASMRVMRFLNERAIPYVEIDITQDPDAAGVVRELNRGYESVPTILFDGRHVATEPSEAELARLLGLSG
jgi:mycoredoxin